MKLASGDGKAREGYFGFAVDSAEGRNYTDDLAFCLAFALENRHQIIQRVVREMAHYCEGSADWGRLINRNHNHAELKDGLWIHRKGATMLTREELRKSVENIESQSVEVSNCSFEMLRWIEDGPAAVRQLLRDYDLLEASFDANAEETIEIRNKLTNACNRIVEMERSAEANARNAAATIEHERQKIDFIRAALVRIMAVGESDSNFPQDGRMFDIAKDALAESV